MSHLGVGDVMQPLNSAGGGVDAAISKQPQRKILPNKRHGEERIGVFAVKIVLQS